MAPTTQPLACKDKAWPHAAVSCGAGGIAWSSHRSQEEAAQPRPPSWQLPAERTHVQPSPAAPHLPPAQAPCLLSFPATDFSAGGHLSPRSWWDWCVRGKEWSGLFFQVLTTSHGSDHVPTTAAFVHLTPALLISISPWAGGRKLACPLCFPADHICAFAPMFFPIFASFF